MHQHQTGGGVTPDGGLATQRIRDMGELRSPAKPDFFWRLRQAWLRKRDLPMMAAQKILGRIEGVIQLESHMAGQKFEIDWTKLAPWQAFKLNELLRANMDVNTLAAAFGGLVTDFGVLSRRTITDTGVAFIVDAWQNTVELEIMKYHGLGTSSTAENQTHTALQAEITASHYTSSNRPAGTLEEGGTANVFKTVGTHTQATAGDTITEHALLSLVSGAAVMFDRHIFTGVPLAVSDSFVTTYSLTLTAGG